MIGTLVAPLVAPVATLPTGAWDILSLLKNSKTWLQTAGGLVLMLLGVAAIVVGGIFLLIRLMGNSQGPQKHGWGQIILLLLAGGAMATGGLVLLQKMTSGAQTTINQLGGGSILSLLPPIPGITG